MLGGPRCPPWRLPRLRRLWRVRRLADLADGPVTLIVEATPTSYEFFVASGGAEPVSLGTLETAPLSSESAGVFTGVYFGLYATTPSGTAAHADFDSFLIEPR